jgi:hypothetical protein
MEDQIADLEADMNRWREAGKDVGRRLGVAQERRNILILIQTMIADGDYVKTNGKRSLEILASRIGTLL